MERTRRVAPGVHVELRSLGPAEWLDEPLVAINWFDAKRPFLYRLYMRLVTRKVERLGGRLLFKGSVAEQLMGPEAIIATRWRW